MSSASLPPSQTEDSLRKQLLEVASQISDDEDDTMIDSSSPNYRTHPEMFQDSQDSYEI